MCIIMTQRVVILLNIRVYSRMYRVYIGCVRCIHVDSRMSVDLITAEINQCFAANPHNKGIWAPLCKRTIM